MTRLARRLGLGDAIFIGLGAMIGAGIFASFGPAARAAGSGLLIGLVLAGGVAFCNAMSSAWLAALYPQSGGTYIYGRERLGPWWGRIAGYAFVFGKLASCAAMALTFGAYVAPDLMRPLALVAIVAVTALNYRGVKKTAIATRIIVIVVLLALTLIVATAPRDLDRVLPRSLSPLPVLQSAGFLFFAFAGYARIATLGEEVIEPAKTIPRAIPIALSITLVVYLVVAVTALAAIGPEALAAAPAPLAAVAGELAPVAQVGAAIASLGVLISLVAGVSRTMFAMADNGDLPRVLAAVHPRFEVPHRAELVVGAVACLIVLVADVRHAIGFSAFLVLGYYAIANAAAWTLGRRVVPALGLVGCLTIAASLVV